MELLANTNQIEDKDARSFDSTQGEVIVAQRDGQFYAYKNVCPHLMVNLEYIEQEFMDMDKEHLICANHGALFQVETGECVFGPCLGESLTAVPIKIVDGQIYLV